MEINPTGPNGPERAADAAAAEGQRVDREAREAAQRKTESVPEQEQPVDSAVVSGEARDLARAENRPPDATIDPERVREIGQRLADGHYDRPEVVDTVANRLADDPELTGL